MTKATSNLLLQVKGDVVPATDALCCVRDLQRVTQAGPGGHVPWPTQSQGRSEAKRGSESNNAYNEVVPSCGWYLVGWSKGGMADPFYLCLMLPKGAPWTVAGL